MQKTLRATNASFAVHSNRKQKESVEARAKMAINVTHTLWQEPHVIF